MTRDGPLSDRALAAAGGRSLGDEAVRFTDKYSNLFRVLK